MSVVASTVYKTACDIYTAYTFTVCGLHLVMVALLCSYLYDVLVCVFVCVRACVRVCVRVCVCGCMVVYELITLHDNILIDVSHNS